MRSFLPARYVLPLVALCAVLVSSCAGSTPAAPGATPGNITLTVFAASSLQTALNQIIPLFEKENLGVTVIPNYAGSPTLRAQLENGARADVFLSADIEQMDAARRTGVVEKDQAIFATRSLTVIVPQDRPAVATLTDLARPGVRLVFAQKDVPVGMYARQALDKMSASPDLGADFAGRVLANLVSEESNVGQVIAKVALGEADAAIVYALSDAEGKAAHVRVIPIPAQYDVIAQYHAAVVTGAAKPAAAHAFTTFLRSAPAQEVFRTNGYGPP